MRTAICYVVDLEDVIPEVIAGPFDDPGGDNPILHDALVEIYRERPWEPRTIAILTIDIDGMAVFEELSETYIGELEDTAWGVQDAPGDDDD